MKRICHAYPANTDLMKSDHTTIQMTMRIARSLKKRRPPRLSPDLSQLGMEAIENGTVPNAVTAQYLLTVKEAFQGGDSGPDRPTDIRMATAIKAVKAGIAHLPRRKKFKPGTHMQTKNWKQHSVITQTARNSTGMTLAIPNEPVTNPKQVENQTRATTQESDQRI